MPGSAAAEGNASQDHKIKHIRLQSAPATPFKAPHDTPKTQQRDHQIHGLSAPASSVRMQQRRGGVAAQQRRTSFSSRAPCMCPRTGACSPSRRWKLRRVSRGARVSCIRARCMLRPCGMPAAQEADPGPPGGLQIRQQWLCASASEAPSATRQLPPPPDRRARSSEH